MDNSGSTRHDFAFARSYRPPAALLGITGSRAYVDLGPDGLHVRFGWWRLRTPLSNIVSVHRTQDFAYLKTAGPPHLSFVDRGVTFATNGDAAVCVGFADPVPAIEPTGRLLHPGATLTLRDLDRFEAELAALTGVTRT